jgi:hypothetical protein
MANIGDAVSVLTGGRWTNVTGIVITPGPSNLSPLAVVDILKYDYELVTIKRPVSTTVDDLGEKIISYTTIGVNVKCDVQPTMSLPFYIGYANSKMQIDTGRYSQNTPMAFFNWKTMAGTTRIYIQVDDVIVRSDGTEYQIYTVDDQATHITCGIKQLV